MQEKYPALFSPIRIGKVELRNRVILTVNRNAADRN